MMTQAKASKKWCPMARVAIHAGTGGAAANRSFDLEIQKHCMCVGPDCAMWRWSEKYAYTETARQKPHENGMEVEVKVSPPSARLGYCGLAGKPEVQ